MQREIVIRQSILNPPWPLVLAVAIFMTLFSIYWFDWDLRNNLNVGEILILIFPTLLVSALMGFAFSHKNEIVIAEKGVRYRTTPFLKKTRFLSTADIKSWEVTDYSYRNFRGLGYRRDFWGNRYYVMRVGKVLKIVTRKNKKFYFGIEQEGKVRQLIEQHWDLKK